MGIIICTHKDNKGPLEYGSITDKSRVSQSINGPAKARVHMYVRQGAETCAGRAKK